MRKHDDKLTGSILLVKRPPALHIIMVTNENNAVFALKTSKILLNILLIFIFGKRWFDKGVVQPKIFNVCLTTVIL